MPLEVDNDVNLAAIAEKRSGLARGVDDFVLLWADEGLGAAIVIGGRLHGGATGGAGEVGFLPVPGTPLVRDVRRGNAGGFQELAGGPQVLALARSLGLARRARPRPPSPRRSRHPGAGDELLATLAERFALGIAALVSVVDPALVVLAGGVLTAGGERLRDLIADEVGSLAADPAPAGAGRRHREPGAAPAPCRPRSPPPATRSSTPSNAAPHRARPGPSPGENHDHDPPIVAASRPPPSALALPLASPPAPASSEGGTNDDPDADVTITFWHGWSARQRGRRRSRRRSTRFEDAQPEHPRQGRRQHHRRQDQPGAARRRLHGARRRLVVHHRQRRPVLLLGRLRRPDAVHGEVRHRPGRDLPAGAAASTRSTRATSARCRC